MFKLNLTIGVIRSTCVIIYFNPIFCPKFSWMIWCLTDLLFFDTPLLYYYINLRSSIIFCLFSGDVDLSSGIFLPCSFVTVSKLFCCGFFQTFVILAVILLPIKSPVSSAAFWIAVFEAVLNASVADCSAWSRSFYMITQVFTYIFTNIFTHIFNKRQKFMTKKFYNLLSLGWT